MALRRRAGGGKGDPHVVAGAAEEVVDDLAFGVPLPHAADGDAEDDAR